MQHFSANAWRSTQRPNTGPVYALPARTAFSAGQFLLQDESTCHDVLSSAVRDGVDGFHATNVAPPTSAERWTRTMRGDAHWQCCSNDDESFKQHTPPVVEDGYRKHHNAHSYFHMRYLRKLLCCVIMSIRCITINKMLSYRRETALRGEL